MNILIIEDEPKVSSFLKKGLELHGFKTEVAGDGITGLKLALSKDSLFHAIVLDVNLPGMDGFAICETIRKEQVTTPILMLTALGTTSDKVRGFELGAQDYLVKPFEFEELLARIKSLIKRSVTEPRQDSVLEIADLVMNVPGKTVSRGGKVIDLTAKEFFLLEYLLRNKGKVLSRSDIAEKIWDINFDTGTNVIDLYIFYLRKKIDRDFSKKLIHTQVGMGYVLKEA